MHEKMLRNAKTYSSSTATDQCQFTFQRILSKSRHELCYLNIIIDRYDDIDIILFAK